MNFQAVEQANGSSITMFGIFIEVGGVQYTQNQKAKSVCKIRDDTGVEHKAHLYQGTGQLPTPAQLNQRCQFSLSTFQGSYQGKPYTGYSGFWNSQAQVGQQNAPQAPPQPAPAPNVPQRDYKTKERTSIERQTVWKGACEYCGRAGIDKEGLLAIVKAGHYFIETGNSLYDIPKPDPSVTEPPTGDDIPF